MFNIANLSTSRVVVRISVLTTGTIRNMNTLTKLIAQYVRMYIQSSSIFVLNQFEMLQFLGVLETVFQEISDL